VISKTFITTLLISLSTLSYASDVIVKFKDQSKIPTDVKLNGNNLYSTVYILKNSDLNRFKNDSNVEFVQESFTGKRNQFENPIVDYRKFDKENSGNDQFNDPQVSQIWSFLDADKNGISINKAYQEYRTTSTSPVIVAVVDTGIDYNHEDLKDVVWTNAGEIPNNGIDDDGNGYIDDIHGINTLIRDKNGKATSENMDTHSHGTHVSGTIGAKQNNRIGIAGIASNVKIMGIRTVPNNGDEKDIDVAEAFIYAAKNGAKIINCSFGKYSNEGEKLIPDTIKYIGDNYGVTVIAAAGNDSSDIDKKPTYPASFDAENLIVIASTGSNGSLSYFSNYGKVSVDVAAPGGNIYSTLPNNKYGSMSGTSMATPTTVGVFAELMSLHPELSPKELKNILFNSVTKNSKYKGKMATEGRIDLYNSLTEARKF
jgi:subtilisin family serine protease